MAFVGEPFETKRNDTKPFTDRLEFLPPGGDEGTEDDPDDPGDWAAVSLVGATVSCFVSDPDTLERIFGGAATVLAPTGDFDPNVQFDPEAADMALTDYDASLFPLTLRAEWEVTYASGIVETFPAGDFFRKWIVGLDHGPA